MSIYEKLNDDLKTAMREKNNEVMSYIRIIKSRITEYEIAKLLDRNNIPDDSLVVQVINSYIKSLKKAIDILEKGGDTKLKAEYEREIKFFEAYLPDQKDMMCEIERLIDEAVASVGKNFGQIMRHVMKNGSFDGSVVKSVVASKLKGL